MNLQILRVNLYHGIINYYFVGFKLFLIIEVKEITVKERRDLEKMESQLAHQCVDRKKKIKKYQRITPISIIFDKHIRV